MAGDGEREERRENGRGEILLVMFTSDVHHPEYTLELINPLKEVRPDALVVAGDLTSSGDIAQIRRFFQIVTKYSTLLYVLGNHDLWLSKTMIRRGVDSLGKMEKVRGMAEQFGFVDLHMSDPVRLGGVWLVGVIGWYDYSFAPPGYSEEDFVRGTPLKDCVPYSTLSPCFEWWNDRVWARLPFSDPEFARMNADLLERKLRKVDGPTIVVTHHVPRRELASNRGFYRAYDGSPLLGKVIERYADKIMWAGYGHNHSGMDLVVGGVTYRSLALPGRDPLVVEL